jgi:hypothetical protein
MDRSPATLAALFATLPAGLQQRFACFRPYVTNQISTGRRVFGREAVTKAGIQAWAAREAQGVARLREAVAGLVRQASVWQTLLGLLTAGPVKSWRYAAEKVAKRFAK